MWSADFQQGAYGRRLSEKFGIKDEVPYIVTRTLQRAEIALTELRIDQPSGQVSDPTPRHDAYVMSLFLRDLAHSYWEDGR